MHTPILSIQYFGNIYFYHTINQYQSITIETQEYYIKQTLRNRTYILSANGILPLIIPVIHQSNKEPIHQKKICYKEKWYKKHYTAIVSAYKKSPYFEHYADEILNILIKPKETYLLQFNLELLKKILSILNIPAQIHLTTQYQKQYHQDFRDSFQTYANHFENIQKPYIQVFSDRFPFQKNLCILDLIFNTGPYSKEYLQFNNDINQFK